ncbi:phospholipase D family protein [Lacisediminimonas profundi]|uniref:phospholipase D family protein n=1 Tax=Lacisediminimonas profundi TaxID=2603856 RepID=UPI00124B7973|nr:phospholipase D family protein [Lacisediminimonas profundi]
MAIPSSGTIFWCATGRAVLACLLALVMAGCAALPSLDARKPIVPTGDTGNTTLGRAVARLASAHPGHSGIYPLPDAGDSFAARIQLVDAAERSIDVQSYIWRNDHSGSRLFQALLRAADRGVRVRILLDDNNTSSLDVVLADLAACRNIEVRLFNPFTLRRARLLNYLTEFGRLNRRMHNKSFTVDNQATIVGGRNIGDAYFDVTDSTTFADMDVMAVGPVVNEVARSFAQYWTSDSAYPAESLLPPAVPGRLDETLVMASDEGGDKLTSAEDVLAAHAYLDALRQLPIVKDLLRGSLSLEWAPVALVVDAPAKGLGQAAESEFLISRFREMVGKPERSLHIISPYLVPTAGAVKNFTALARAGIKVRILTNSLEATDVSIVHAAYAKWRLPLVAGGVELFEMKRLAGMPQRPKHRLLRGSLPTSSGTSLHAKVMAIDDTRFFVGSYNLDRRSRDTNTEMGFLIDSPVLAKRLANAFLTAIPSTSYRVGLRESGGLQWTEQKDGVPGVVHDAEPGRSVWSGIGQDLLTVLPLDFLF